MAYKLGHCTQNGKQLMVRDTNGRLNSIKPDAYEADLLFEHGSVVHILISEEALNNPDLDKIYEELMHPAGDSFKSQPQSRDFILQNFGKPVKLLRPIKLLKQGVV